MNDKIKILILEDNQHDVELMQRELKNAGLMFTSEIVQTLETFESALDSFNPDIILSDYAFPSFDGTAASHVRQKKYPDTPFIIVSGFIGEEKAVKLIKDGVTDYVAKDKLFGLAPKIARALKDTADRKKAESDTLKLMHELQVHQIELEQQNEELQKANFSSAEISTRFTELYDFAPTAYFTLEKEGVINHTNLSGAALLGEVRSKVKSRLFALYIANESKNTFNSFLENIDLDKSKQTCEAVLVAGNDRKHIIFSGVPDGIAGQNLISAVDITKRKQEEEQLRYQAHILKSIDQAVIVTTPAGIVTYVNQFAETMYGWAATDAPGKSIMELTVPQISLAQAQEIMASLRDGRNWQGEFMAQRQDGSLIMVQVVNTPIMDEHGNITAIAGISSDITQRKLAEAELEIIHKRLELATHAAKIGIWEYGVNDNSLIWDDQMYALYGITKTTFSGTYEAWQSGLHPEDRERSEHESEEAIAGQKDFNTEFRVVWPDQSIHHIRALGNVILDDTGKAVKMIGANYDITERKKLINELVRAKQRVEESEGRLIIAQAVTKVGSWETDLQTLEVVWSEETYKIFGTDHLSFQASHSAFLEFVHPDDKEKVDKAFLESFTKTGINSVEHRIITANNIIKHVEERWQIHSDQNGKPTRAVGACQDISEMKQTEEKLDKAFKELQHGSQIQGSILNALPASIALVDNNGVIIAVNETWRKFGIENNLTDPNQCIGENYISISNSATGEEEGFGKKMAKGIEQVLSNVLLSFEMEYPCDTHDKKLWFKVGVTPIIKGQSAGAVIMHIDITERKQAELRLKEAKEKAEESDRLKSAFLANMSHEIRTPMNSIMGFAGLIQKKGVTPQKEKEYLAMIQKSGDRMLNIINDIISISKIESGETQVTLSPTNINEQLEFIRAFFEPEASAKGIQVIVTNTLSTHKAIINTDREKVYGTLANLVKNAMKFTHAGTIEIGCHEKPEQAELEFYVKDEGIGIRHDHLNFVFERFRQVNESSTRNYEGAGLGLAISKAHVEKLGGKIWVESEVGKGSTFYFTIPSERNLVSTKEKVEAVEPGLPNDREPSNQGLKIVIAEDDFLSAAFLKAVLSINGNEILHASKGTEVVEMVRNNPDTDVVLMDISMPELNGYEASRQIRQFNKAVCIIVQSGYAFEDTIKQATEAGCTDFISKPIDENKLLSLIEKHVRK